MIDDTSMIRGNAIHDQDNVAIRDMWRALTESQQWSLWDFLANMSPTEAADALKNSETFWINFVRACAMAGMRGALLSEVDAEGDEP